MISKYTQVLSLDAYLPPYFARSSILLYVSHSAYFNASGEDPSGGKWAFNTESEMGERKSSNINTNLGLTV